MQKSVYLVKTAHHEYMLTNSYVDKFIITTQVTDNEYNRLVELFNKQFINHNDNGNSIIYTIHDKNELAIMKSMFELVHRSELYTTHNNTSQVLCIVIAVLIICPLAVVFIVGMVMLFVYLI